MSDHDQSPSPYSEKFFTANAKSANLAGEPILQIVRDLYVEGSAPTSIMDLGCGSGGWLAAAGRLGFTHLRGYDGPWADPDKYVEANIDFVALDLEVAEVPTERFDLAMSVEVAEHISEARSDFFVDVLCAASDVVMFGAAIPQQTGTHHITERWQSFWIEKFRARGYEVYDVIRPAVWDRKEIRFWFRQNTFVFVKDTCTVIDRDKLREAQRPIYDVVHPENFARKIARGQRRAQRLQGKLDAAQARSRRLRGELDHAQRSGPRAWRSISADKLPGPVRPVATRAWRSLPEDLRRRLRG